MGEKLYIKQSYHSTLSIVLWHSSAIAGEIIMLTCQIINIKNNKAFHSSKDI